MDSKKSIRSGAGPFVGCVVVVGCDGVKSGNAGFADAGLDSFAIDLPFAGSGLPTPLPALFSPCWARYCLLFVSKSLSCKYSSREVVRLVGACLIFGTSSRVVYS